MEMVRNGVSKTKIKEYLKEKYNISDKTAYKIVHDALADLNEAYSNIDIGELKAEYAERIESLVESSMSKGDINSALKAQDMLNKLFSLYTENKNINLNTDTITFEFN
jgi:hypothetical protein